MYYDEIMAFAFMFLDYCEFGEHNQDKNFFVLEGTLDGALWAGTLANLSWLLELHYGVVPMILIDEYDTPIQ